MTEAPVRLRSDATGAAATPPFDLIIGPGGAALTVVLPAARKLQSAALQLAAISAAAAEMAPAPSIESDAFTVGADGRPVLGGGAGAHWLALDFGREQAVTGLTLIALNATASKPMTGARVRMLSAGQWLPLPARDTLAFANGHASARFPACAASRLMIDLLAENKLGDTFTGVLVPGAVDLSNLSVSVSATPQPCHVSLAVGDDAAFFRVGGPLPASPVAVDGLTRALNRFVTDHPGATSIPLLLRAAAAATVRIAAFDASLEPAPSSPGGTGTHPAPPPAPPRPELPGPGLAGNAPAPTAGRWCDAQRSAAQKFAPSPAGRGLSAIELQLRTIGAAGAAGTLALHADAGGFPAALPAAASIAWRLAPAVAPRWLRCELPLPAPELTAPWWAVLRVSDGEIVWYQSTDPVAGIAGSAWQTDGGAWMPLASPGAWLGSRLWWLDPSASTA